MAHFGGSFFDLSVCILYNNNMITLKYIEDYLEVLGGFREITANGVSTANIFGGGTSPISLARYDVAIVQSMASATTIGTPLTDKQSELALRLVSKYQRQFAAKGIDVTPSVNNPAYRMPVRIVDRTKSVSIRDQSILLRFPYDKNLVPLVTSASKESHGSFKFDRERKEWTLGLTEYNLNWAAMTGAAHGFDIAPEVTELLQLILDAEKLPFKIELTIDDDSNILVSNAAPSLLAYIDDNLGGLCYENLLKLVDYAPVLGYTVDPDIMLAISTEYSEVVSGMLQYKECHVMRNDPLSDGLELLKPMIEYAELSNRWPICIYEPDASNRLRNTARTLFEPGQILDTTDKKLPVEVDLTGIKCVYFNKLKRAWKHRVPILISTNAMLYGGEKQAILQAAEKVVYYTATTYDKEAKTIAGKINN